MNNLVILGAGTVGTALANRLIRALPRTEWCITLIDQHKTHYYQPGFLYIPFEIYTPQDVVKQRVKTLDEDILFMLSEIERVEAEDNRVLLKDGNIIYYDYLIVATGTTPRPDETEGLAGPAYGDFIHDFYTFEGSTQLAEKMRNWEGGKLVINVMEMPIKCPVAPLEFCFLADWYFTEKGMRDRVDITFVTPLPGAFTKPVATAVLSQMLAERNINVVPEFDVMEVDAEQKQLVSYEEESVPFDLLVTVPVNMGADFLEESGLGDELNHVPVDIHTFRSLAYDNIFALGDAAALPTSKAGSVAHFSADIFVENFLDEIAGREPKAQFDGHANCFVETGFGKALLIDFNYDVEPLPGRFPLGRLGPLPLLKESRANHWSKLAFRWLYWNRLIAGKSLFMSPHLSMVGKEKPESVLPSVAA